MHFQRVFAYILVFGLTVSPLFGQARGLRGSVGKQQKQNSVADHENLTRIQDDKQLKTFEKKKILVHLPKSKKIKIDGRLNKKFRYCRPWTAAFLKDISRDYFAEFHSALQVNSAVRTMDYQKELQRRNGNAAGTKGDTKSSHPTGATIDIAKRQLNVEELNWMRRKLKQLQDKNLLVVTEENRQPVFHIMVFETYSGQA